MTRFPAAGTLVREPLPGICGACPSSHYARQAISAAVRDELLGVARTLRERANMHAAASDHALAVECDVLAALLEARAES